MSYDVSVDDIDLNYTANMRHFFLDFDVYPPSWSGKGAGEVGERISRGLVRIRRNDVRQLGRAYDSPNGWGRVATAIAWLEKVREACADADADAVVQVTA